MVVYCNLQTGVWTADEGKLPPWLMADGPARAAEQLYWNQQLLDVQQMNPAEYREAWAWVHLMLRSEPENVA